MSLDAVERSLGIAPPPVAAGIIGTEGSEKARLDRLRRREMMYKRLFSGHYKVFHEVDKAHTPWAPAPWMVPAVRDFCAHDSIRQAHAKGRQTYATSSYGVMMADYLLYEVASTSMIWNMNYNEAHATMKTKVSSVLRETFPGLASDETRMGISEKKIEYFRKEGMGGNSVIYAGEVSGRGSTATFTLATEFPVVCGEDPVRARKWIDANLSAAQFGSHIVEGTASDIGGSGPMYEIIENALELQRAGHPPTRKDFILYFYPWFAKPNATISDEEWGEGRAIEKECLDYFKFLADPSREYMVGKEIRTGGIQLTEGQKRFYYLAWLNDKQRSFKRMHADYPSLLSESQGAGANPQYCLPLIRTAEAEERIGLFPAQAGVQVHSAWDVGWEDQTVCIFFQRDTLAKHWRVLGCFAVDHWHSPAIMEKLASYNWEERTGYPLKIWLPHDADNATHGNQKITQQVGGTIYHDFRLAGWDVGSKEIPPVNPRPKPGKKGMVFNEVRQIFPLTRFDKIGSRQLLENLRLARIQELRVDNVMTDQLKKGKGKDWHDAFGIYASVALELNRDTPDEGADEYMAHGGAGRRVYA